MQENEEIYDPIPTSLEEKKNLIYWMKEHPMWNHPEMGIECFRTLVDIDLAYVNPIDNTVNDDPSLNTKQEIWIEAGPYVDCSEWHNDSENKWLPSHDIRLDCGGETLEEAFLNLAVRVKKHYGDYQT